MKVILLSLLLTTAQPVGNDCGCHFGKACKCLAAGQRCSCNGILPSAIKAFAQVQIPARDYEQMAEIAVALNKPLVVGVGCNPPQGPWLSVRVEAPFGAEGEHKKPCVIVSRVVKGGLVYYPNEVLPATNAASAERVKAILFSAPRVPAPVQRTSELAPTFRAASVRSANC